MNKSKTDASGIFAEAEAAGAHARNGRGRRFIAYLKNPLRIFVWLAEHGFLRWMKDEPYLKRFYRAKMGETLHLDPPVTYNDKVQWLKLHDRDPLHCTLADKIAVRDYVEKKIGGEYLTPLLGVWENPEEIDLTCLPKRFVLKCSHNSGGVIVCMDKDTFDLPGAKRILKAQLKTNYYTIGREWLYKDIPRRVLAEEYIGGEDGTPPRDYKFYCFNGVVRSLIVCTNRVGKHVSYYFFDRDFHVFPLNRQTVRYMNDAGAEKIEKPPHFDEMVVLAETLSRDILHVRVDFYDTAAGVRFGECTFFDSSGFDEDYTEEGAKIMGGYLNLEDIYA